jgi:MDMPI C-terminal domain/Mycothiol maleylpyruvate isomerase N-terminal domain
LDPDAYLAHLERDQRAFAACLRGDLSAPVRSCPGWRLHDLADHLGRGNLWAAAAVTERRGDHQAPPAPQSQGEVAAWFEDTCAVRLDATDTGSTWRLGAAEPVATVRGRAGDLLLLLWRRLPDDHETLHWDGDRETASDVLGSGLVP